MVCAAAIWLGGSASGPSHQWSAYVAFIDDDRRVITRIPPYACGMRRPRWRTTNFRRGAPFTELKNLMGGR